MSAGVGGVLGIGAGAAAITGSVIQGQKQKSAQKKAERNQANAQRLATSRAAAELRTQEANQRRLNQKRPNIAGLLSTEREGALSGAGSTTLTGAQGIGREQLTLAKSSLLGVS